MSTRDVCACRVERGGGDGKQRRVLMRPNTLISSSSSSNSAIEQEKKHNNTNSGLGKLTRKPKHKSKKSTRMTMRKKINI